MIDEEIITAKNETDTLLYHQRSNTWRSSQELTRHHSLQTPGINLVTHFKCFVLRRDLQGALLTKGFLGKCFPMFYTPGILRSP